jgi:hypothetical protein
VLFVKFEIESIFEVGVCSLVDLEFRLGGILLEILLAKKFGLW